MLTGKLTSVELALNSLDFNKSKDSEPLLTGATLPKSFENRSDKSSQIQNLTSGTDDEE